MDKAIKVDAAMDTVPCPHELQVMDIPSQRFRCHSCGELIPKASK